MNEPPKSIFKSKSALAGALATISGALGLWQPDVDAFLSAHASTIIGALGALHVILRLVTRGRVSLFAE